MAGEVVTDTVTSSTGKHWLSALHQVSGWHCLSVTPDCLQGTQARCSSQSQASTRLLKSSPATGTALAHSAPPSARLSPLSRPQPPQVRWHPMLRPGHHASAGALLRLCVHTVPAPAAGQSYTVVNGGQCGGSQGVCSQVNACADAVWPGAMCGPGYSCQRYDSTW